MIASVGLPPQTCIGPIVWIRRCKFYLHNTEASSASGLLQTQEHFFTLLICPCLSFPWSGFPQTHAKNMHFVSEDHHSSLKLNLRTLTVLSVLLMFMYTTHHIYSCLSHYQVSLLDKTSSYDMIQAYNTWYIIMCYGLLLFTLTYVFQWKPFYLLIVCEKP